MLPDPVPGVLLDGTLVRYAPVTPAHREQLRRGFEETSPESRYRRFLSPLSRLTDEQLDYLTNVDFVDHVAWGAEIVETGRGIGIGRWIRLVGEPDAAEAAVAVVDEFQGRGVGRALLQLLADSALARGVHRFRAEVLADNERMLAILERVGAVTIGRSGSVLDIEIPLPPQLS